MIRAARARIAAVAGAGLLAACTQTDAPTDPCADAATCVRLDVSSLVIKTIDQLELDVVYAGHHATTTTGTIGNPVDLPFSLALTLDLPDPPVIEVDLIAAGKLGGSAIGATADSTTVQQGQHAIGEVFLEPVDSCIEGALYCGGTGVAVVADGRTLYRCTGGVPIFYMQCSSGCFPHFEPNGVCVGGGLCRDGGTYCGGHVLDGDPSTLYVCSSFEGTRPMPCPAGCMVRGDGDDACK